jgi:hypothetical protein
LVAAEEVVLVCLVHQDHPAQQGLLEHKVPKVRQA